MSDNTILSPEQTGAREFWRQASAGSLPSNYFFNTFLDIQSRYERDEFDSLQSDLDQLLGDLGYGTDMDTVSDELSAGASTDLGYWSGSYALFDDDGTRYWLVVGRDGATLQLPPTTVDPTVTEIDSVDKYKSLTILTDSAFANGELTIGNDQFAFTLNFERAFTDEQMTQDGFAGKTLNRQGQPRCNGSVQITQNGESRALSVKGKRGSYTREGVLQADDGDPIATWAGSYTLINTTDDSAWTWSGDPLLIEANGHGVSLQWGSLKGSNVRFNNNVVVSDFEKQANTSIALQFETLVDGSKRLQAAMTRNGANQNLLGFWTHDTGSSQPDAQEAATEADAMSFGVVNDALTLDLSALSDDAVVKLPTAVPNNDYELPLSLSNATVLGSKPYTWNWSVPSPPSAASAASVVRINVDSTDSTKATLTASSALANVGFIDVEVEIKGSSGTRTLTLRLEVLNLAPLVVTPTTLPPVIRDMDYTITLVANGGRAPYTWEEAGSSLPPNFTFDATTQRLSGKVSATTASQDVYALRVKVSSVDSVKMAPLMVTLPISIAEASQIAKAEADYTTFVLSIFGSIFLAISAVKSIYELWKERQKNAGDPTFEKNYPLAKEMAASMTSWVEDAVGKKFATYIETALQYDTKYPDRLLDYKTKKLTAIEIYSRFIRKANKAIVEKMREIMDEQNGTNNPNEIARLNRELEELKVDIMENITQVDSELRDQIKLAKEEEASEANKSTIDKLKEHFKR